MKLVNILKEQTNTIIVPSGTPVLKRGSRGDAVKQIQTILGINDKNSKFGIDGKFGPETHAWLKVWQEEHSLTADGIYGPNTAAAMKKDPSPVKDQGKVKQELVNLPKSDKQTINADTTKPIILNQSYFYKQLESTFPDMFRGDQKGVQNPKKILSIGGAANASETYEKALRRGLKNALQNVSEVRLLDMFEKLSRNLLATFLKRYKDINGTELYIDLRDTSFDTSEINSFLNIIKSKSLSIDANSKRLMFKNNQDKWQYI
jgi:hypothetical protein